MKLDGRSGGRRLAQMCLGISVGVGLLAASSVPGRVVTANPTAGTTADTTDDVSLNGATSRVLAETLAPRLAPGLIQAPLGCAESKSAADLNAFFAGERGPLIGWDNPHVIQLGPERWLWLVHDTYLDYAGTATTLHNSGRQLQNVAFVQQGRCFHLVHRGTPSERLNFELGDERIPSGHFLWPLGSEVHEGRLMVFWGETVTADPYPPPGHGIVRNGVATWLATYDIATLARVNFEPAPNPGVEPQFGFAVASDDSHSYLFGNTNQLNFWRNGGYGNGPHSATKMYLARVPRGRLDVAPEYWDGAGWSDIAASAVPYSERFYAENTMQPRHIDGRWVSVVNRDGFFGRDVFIETADDPWGPWITRRIVSHEPRPSAAAKNTYQPIILPWSSPANGISVAISENAMDWDDAVVDPSIYRPGVFSVPWPHVPMPTPESTTARSFDNSVDKLR